MQLFILKSKIENQPLTNVNGTLRVYDNYNTALRDAEIFVADILFFDVDFIIQNRILNVYKSCIEKGIKITKNNIAIQSLFSVGGTLIGKEKEIECFLNKLKNQE